ncbi:MAG TPA: sortase [Candidatus Limnocylindrales bacterium]|nr:sortase [Candidatus Limnocylindrales bacterium]
MDTYGMFVRRITSALLTAVGVVLVAAGLLTYTQPVAAAPVSSQGPVASQGPAGLPTLEPLVTPGPSASAAAASRVATRVVVPALGIDLPVIKQPGTADSFPPCNVAMYITQLHQPGQAGATYLYAHARTGMFLPILNASLVNNGKSMIGMLIEVYTSDNMEFLYEAVAVRRHITDLDSAFATTDETLWLQTSEGPVGTVQKVQVIAKPLSSGPADPVAAHPTPHPIVCG